MHIMILKSFKLAVLFCVVFGAVIVGVLGWSLMQTAHAKDTPKPPCNDNNFYCAASKLSVGTNAIRNIAAIKVDMPTPPRTMQTVTYSVETRGAIAASLAEFKTQAHETLNDKRGWARMGVSFQEVASGGQFTLVLAEANQLPAFSSGCSSLYSCNVGRYVIINQDRWLGATPSWNNAGGSLRDYRHMVINHETGHWLGHGHSVCLAAGQSAPVMQQQSIDLHNCHFNPWPLDGELHSTRLGV